MHAAEALQEIVVKDGDTLWGISNYYLKDPKRWPEILKHNNQLSNNPTVALPGMRLKVPVMLIKESLRAAELVYLLNEVRFRRKDSNEWKRAQINMELYNDDGLRTMNESIAKIKFPTGETVNLNENSLVLVRPEKGQDTVELLAGDVRARRSRVITAGGTRIDPQGPDADYRTRIRLDKSELVLVYRGRVDVTAQGKTVRIPEGFGSEIMPMMPPAEPVPLPKIPLVAAKQGVEAPSPGDGDAVVKTLPSDDGLWLQVEMPPLKDFAAEDRSAAVATPSSARARAVTSRKVVDKYHVQVDDAETFDNPLVDKYSRIGEPLNLTKLGLLDGDYWWRVAFVDTLGMEGAFSGVQTFRIDLAPPVVTIVQPGEGDELAWDEEFLQVIGETEPGTRIEVDDKSIPVGEQGRFTASIYLHEGKNRLQLRARDASGNETRIERVVYRLVAGQKGRAAKTARATKGEEDGPRQGFLASLAVGLLTISTIVGIVLLIIQ